MRAFRIVNLLGALLLSLGASGQSKVLRDFRPLVDTIGLTVTQHTGVETKLLIKSIVRRGNALDFYFNEALAFQPWRPGDAKWFKDQLRGFFPSEYKTCTVGEVYTNKQTISELELPKVSRDGEPRASKFRITLPPSESPLVERVGRPAISKGLSHRHLAIWQSHGRYYEAKEDRWKWQRAPFFTTVEDLYTQSFVLPYLLPMLENSGAVILDPRERDPQSYEAVVDNDESFSREDAAAQHNGAEAALIRHSGEYREDGHWSSAGSGFADAKYIYSGLDNPFTMGTARELSCTRDASKKASAQWLPDIPKSGHYAVYISYKSLPNSTESAHYTVNHLGGSTEFIVNQKMGGGTWIYLGTFPFDEGLGGSVTLDNATPSGRNFVPGSVVTADAVRFGGGMGKVARGPKDSPKTQWTTSGLPAYQEGALYNLQWAGADSTIIKNFPDDYTNDFASRGPWVSMLTGGSRVNPTASGKGIPIDLALAFHSDAGVHPNDSTVGTLAIYTLKCEGKKVFPSGESRLGSREYADFVQTQVVDDIRAAYDPRWMRRELRDKSYSECRTPGVPAMILELLSHQNFEDMKYGLDPGFRFTVCRAVYKGILKFLSARYGVPYEVQPLPINSFSATLTGSDEVRLNWRATPDTLESTAMPKGFILYSRVSGVSKAGSEGASEEVFNDGEILKATLQADGSYSATLPIVKGRIYSYRISGYNDGGEGFPSEILSVGSPVSSPKGKVLVVNNFDRVSSPQWFDTPDYAGFLTGVDKGVSTLMTGTKEELSYLGDMYEFRRDLPWVSDDNPGFGASHLTHSEGEGPKANTFDYPLVHGLSLMRAGYELSSCSASAFSSDSTLLRAPVVDLICGRQLSTPSARKIRYQVFPQPLREALSAYTLRGGRLLVSGSHIASDLWAGEFKSAEDSLYQVEARAFVLATLGYSLASSNASRGGQCRPIKNKKADFSSLKGNAPLPTQSPDGLKPEGPKSAAVLKYSDTLIPAAVAYETATSRVLSLGFPLSDSPDRDTLMKLIMTYLTQK